MWLRCCLRLLPLPSIAWVFFNCCYLETYGWDWYKELNLPEAPQKRYYSKFKVGSKEGNGYLVEDLDIPSDRVHKAVKWLASDFLRFANKETPDGGQRISRDLVVTHKVRLPSN